MLPFLKRKLPLSRGVRGVYIDNFFLFLLIVSSYFMRRRIIPYDPKLKQLARNLRNSSTQSEIILWEYLKGKQMHGFDFHWQKPIDQYIVDYFCSELMLAIELDGITHFEPYIIIKDRIKSARLKELGISLLRFEDDLVFDDIDFVLDKINEFINEFLKTHPCPSPEGKTGC